MGNDWEYGEFAHVITPEVRALCTTGFTVTRTREHGTTRFQVVCTNLVRSTWTPDGQRSEEETYNLLLADMEDSLHRSDAELRSEEQALREGERLYQAQYAYACGYYD